MSQSNDLINAIVTAITPDLVGYTEVRSTHKPISTIDIEEYPLAMAFNPIEEHDRGDLGQFTETITVTLFLLRDRDQVDETTEVVAMRADVDAVKARFDVDPRISSTVDYAWVADAAVIENLSEHVLAVITISTVRARS